MRHFFMIYWILLLGLFSSCTLFLGNIRSTEEKSSQYLVGDLSLMRQSWKKSDPLLEGESPDAPRPDLIYESRHSASTISLTSGCKNPNAKLPVKKLTEHARTLFLGLADLDVKSARTIRQDGIEGLRSSVAARMNDRAVHFELVVFEKAGCYYDLLLVGRAPLSSQEQTDFNDFVSTFHFK